MMTPGSANALLLADAGYQIQRSLRFRKSASAYLNRTFSTPTSRRIFTSSFWMKRGENTQIEGIFGQGAGPEAYISFSGNSLEYYDYFDGTYRLKLVTTQVFRDFSGWYHIVVATDTTQATASNRIKIYVNGVQVTSFSSATYPSQNFDCTINSAASVNIARFNFASPRYSDLYLAEFNFIDGQALTPASFGEINPVTGVWSAKKYAGTYGTNGFFLNFSDNSAATAAAIGKDSSGNGNNWTPNNISVTAGVTYDSMIDVPTPYADGGNGRGNYATWNPLTGGSPTSGNLVTAGNTQSTIGLSSGAYYWEVEVASSNGYTGVGFTNGPYSQYLRWNVAYGSWTNGSAGTLNIGSQTAQTNCTVMCAMDVDNNKFWMGVNGTWFSSGDPASGANPALTLATSTTGFWFPEVNFYAGGTGTANFGQRPFAYTPPTGFKALHTGNLPEPVIKQGASYMAASLYTGTGYGAAVPVGQTIVNSVNGVGFQPDLVWVKERSGAGWNILTDSVRGVTKNVYSNSTGAEATNNGTDVTTFNSNGFSVGTDSAGDGVNRNGATVVAWQWKANGAAVSNTAGSITSQVSAGVSQGFSVVTYTGTGAAATVGHGLGVAPSMIIIKARTGGGVYPRWHTYHASLGANAVVHLDTTSAVITPVTGYWNNTAPSSTVFSVGTDIYGPNVSPGTYVAYCFSEVAGYSKFGSYTGNGSADGPFVFLGFRPAFVLIKNASTGGIWYIWDNKRIIQANGDAGVLQPQSSEAEADYNASGIDLLSNGFKIRNTDTSDNNSGATIVYAAFAEHPFKNSLAR